jgi:hypothetical protein
VALVRLALVRLAMVRLAMVRLAMVRLALKPFQRLARIELLRFRKKMRHQTFRSKDSNIDNASSHRL